MYWLLRIWELWLLKFVSSKRVYSRRVTNVRYWGRILLKHFLEATLPLLLILKTKLCLFHFVCLFVFWPSNTKQLKLKWTWAWFEYRHLFDLLSNVSGIMDSPMSGTKYKISTGFKTEYHTVVGTIYFFCDRFFKLFD